MVCVKCGTENPDGAKYCSNCNAVLFQAAPTGLPNASTLDLEEMVDYPVPETHYQSPILQHLAWSIHEFIEEEGELEPILEAYEGFREIFEGFRSEIPSLKDYQYQEQGKWDDDPIPTQIKYLVSKAEELYEQGEKEFEAYFEQIEKYEEEIERLEESDDDSVEEPDFPDPGAMVTATKRWLNCNDNICLVFEFLVGRSRAFNEMADELEADLAALDAMPDDEPEEGEGEAQAPAEPAPQPTGPTDSSDLG